MSSQQTPLPKKGETVDLYIESLAFGAKGIARLGEMVCFVEGAIPGQTVKARLLKKKRSYFEARTLEVIKPSEWQVDPVCSHFQSCGGCSLQHLQYEQQLKAKEDQVKDSIARLGGFKNVPMQPILPSLETEQYRNKMEFSFSRDRWLSVQEIDSNKTFEKTGLFLGMHAKGFFDKVIDLQECHLVEPIASEILDTVREIARESGLGSYSTRDHTGFWRFLIIRKSKNTGDLLVNVVTYSYNKEIAEQLEERLCARFPQITSLLYSTTQSKASVAYSEKEYLLHGKKTIFEKLGNYQFEVSGNSFFQTNTRQAERLYDVVVEMADFKSDETVYDLYCGAGTISIYISEYVNKVIGFESVESAVIDAYKNCAINSINNCDFELGDLKDQISDTQRLAERYGAPDTMIIDPPRSGMHPNTLAAVLELEPKKIVHVSCNPATLARDLGLLCEEKYTLTAVKPVDMFPHTAHIEAVALLQLK